MAKKPDARNQAKRSRTEASQSSSSRIQSNAPSDVRYMPAWSELFAATAPESTRTRAEYERIKKQYSFMYAKHYAYAERYYAKLHGSEDQI